jgi:SAM-dependent methyltransferase
MINLGCGNNPLPKPWENIDKFYYPGTDEHPKTEEMNRADGNPEDFDWKIGDFTDLGGFEDNSIDKINICHALEHVSWEDAQKTLKEIYRILKPGGDIEVEVPNLEAIFANVLNGIFHYGDMLDLVYGGRDSNVYWGGHFCGFTPPMLSAELSSKGFKDVKMVDVGFGTSKPEPDRNFRMRGVK